MRRTVPVVSFLHRAVFSGTVNSVNKFQKNGTLNFHRLSYLAPLRRCSTTTTKMKAVPNVLMGKEDRYRGLHVELQQEMSVEDFDQILTLSVAQWQKEDKLAVWLDVPISLSHYIPVAARHGFSFHHAEGDLSTLYKWLRPDLPCMLPRFATHQVGVAGCIVREDTKEVLVIQDKHRTFQLWKFPGGLSDLGEDLSETAEREVFEETGIKAEFQGILTFRQQHKLPGAFGRSDIYFLCYMKPLTYELRPDSNEILKCVWMKIEDLQSDSQTSAMTHRVVELLKTGLEHGFDKVVLACPEFKSVYKGVSYKLHHADVGLPDLSPSAYKHYVSSVFPRD